MNYNSYLITFFTILVIQVTSVELIKQECSIDHLDEDILTSMTKMIVPELGGKRKGDAGRIAVIGGSAKYTGAPYFAAISALKVGADLVSVITTEDAAPVIKAYSPDLITIPYKQIHLSSILRPVDVVVLGPGLGRDPENLQLAYDVIEICKVLQKPLVIDADGLYAVYKNISILQNFPKPGVILTPNYVEASRLISAFPFLNNNGSLYTNWGDYVTILIKGKRDEYHTQKIFAWSLEEGGSGRRVGGQGDVLAGALGTFYHWALQVKSTLCGETTDHADLLAQSIATYAAAKFTRACNSKAFELQGRSMTTSDMLNQIHVAFDNNFL